LSQAPAEDHNAGGAEAGYTAIGRSETPAVTNRSDLSDGVRAKLGNGATKSPLRGHGTVGSARALSYAALRQKMPLQSICSIAVAMPWIAR
jgi:hypothetical protein